MPELDAANDARCKWHDREAILLSEWEDPMRGFKIKLLAFASAAGFLALSSTAHATVYAVGANGCQSAGYGSGTLVTGGRYEGLYLCAMASDRQTAAMDARIAQMRAAGLLSDRVVVGEDSAMSTAGANGRPVAPGNRALSARPPVRFRTEARLPQDLQMPARGSNQPARFAAAPRFPERLRGLSERQVRQQLQRDEDVRSTFQDWYCYFNYSSGDAFCDGWFGNHI